MIVRDCSTYQKQKNIEMIFFSLKLAGALCSSKCQIYDFDKFNLTTHHGDFCSCF